MCNNPKIKVLIVEDHKILGEGLALLIQAESNLVVCDFVAPAEEAMIACYKNRGMSKRSNRFIKSKKSSCRHKVY